MVYRNPEACTICGVSPVKARGWCSVHYSRFLKHGDPHANVAARRVVPRGLTDSEYLQFLGWTVIQRDAPYAEGPCWEWGGGRDRDGYGVCAQTRMGKAHRLAFRTWVGPIGEGKVIRHRCDNPPCINPHHLEIGSTQENDRDRVERGRAASWENSIHRKYPVRTVRKVKRMLNEGASMNTISDTLGPSRKLVKFISDGSQWATLDANETWVLSLDPCAESEVSSLGWVLASFTPETVMEVLDSGVIEGGFEGFCEHLRGNEFFLLDPDVVICEKFVSYNRNATPTPLLAEGVVRCVRPDVVLQPSSALALVSEVQAKALYPEIRAQGHHADNLSALRHLLAYLVKNRHKPTLRAFTSIARQR